MIGTALPEVRVAPSRIWVVVVIAALVGAGVAIAARTLGVVPMRVASTSMSPAIHPGDWVVTRKPYDAERGDVVLYRFPLGTAGRAVKRVVAVGGDEVAVRERSVAVGGRTIEITGAPSRYAGRARLEAVPEDHVFLLGDNAARSIDSRSLGPVPESEIVGRVVFVISKAMVVTAIALGALAALLAGGLLYRSAQERGRTR